MTLTTELPKDNLGKWLLLLSSIVLVNFVHSFIVSFYPQLSFMDRIIGVKYREVTPLASRMLGAWDIMTSILRSHCAYNLNNPPLYRVTLWSFIIAFAGMFSEALVFKTTDVTTSGTMNVLLACAFTIGWMTLKYRDYALERQTTTKRE